MGSCPDTDIDPTIPKTDHILLSFNSILFDFIQRKRVLPV